MPLDLSDTLVIGISSTALFDLSEADAVFRRKYNANPGEAIQEYRKYMETHETEDLDPGTGFPLIKVKLLSIMQTGRPFLNTEQLME